MIKYLLLVNLYVVFNTVHLVYYRVVITIVGILYAFIHSLSMVFY